MSDGRIERYGDIEVIVLPSGLDRPSWADEPRYFYEITVLGPEAAFHRAKRHSRAEAIEARMHEPHRLAWSVLQEILRAKIQPKWFIEDFMRGAVVDPTARGEEARKIVREAEAFAVRDLTDAIGEASALMVPEGRHIERRRSVMRKGTGMPGMKEWMPPIE